MTGEIGGDCRVFIRENEQKHGAVIADGIAPDLLTYLRIGHVNELVSWAIASGRERGDFVTEILFELAFRAKDEFADAGVKAVSSDDEIEITRGLVREG